MTTLAGADGVTGRAGSGSMTPRSTPLWHGVVIAAAAGPRMRQHEQRISNLERRMESSNTCSATCRQRWRQRC